MQMSSENTVIAVESVSKCFNIYHKPSDRLKQLIFRSKQFYTEHWALRDVSLHVKKGETVGIIGRNGSGKSTLLQLITGIMPPSGGYITTSGRISALLELGSGFNPEFTGKENIILNATILGLSREEIDARFDEIVAFADIGEYLEHPVKTYSSGMVVRLAFSVAINVEPDVLIVDEALSVGDELFQRKCFGRIQQIKESGTTILFVSHSANTIVELCDRAILLDNGEHIQTGEPKKVVAEYQKQLLSKAKSNAGKASHTQNNQENTRESEMQAESPIEPDFIEGAGYFNFYDEEVVSKSIIKYPNNGADIRDITIETLQGKKVNVLATGQHYNLRYRVQFEGAHFMVRAGNMIKSRTGIELAGLHSHHFGESIEFVESGSVLEFVYRFKCIFLPGHYFMNTGVVTNVNMEEAFLHRIVDAIAFKVIASPDRTVAGIVDASPDDTNDRTTINTIK